MQAISSFYFSTIVMKWHFFYHYFILYLCESQDVYFFVFFSLYMQTCVSLCFYIENQFNNITS